MQVGAIRNANEISYNSAVYSSIYATDYMVFMGTEDTLQDADPTQFLLKLAI